MSSPFNMGSPRLRCRRGIPPWKDSAELCSGKVQLRTSCGQYATAPRPPVVREKARHARPGPIQPRPQAQGPTMAKTSHLQPLHMELWNRLCSHRPLGGAWDGVGVSGSRDILGQDPEHAWDWQTGTMESSFRASWTLTFKNGRSRMAQACASCIPGLQGPLHVGHAMDVLGFGESRRVD